MKKITIIILYIIGVIFLFSHNVYAQEIQETQENENYYESAMPMENYDSTQPYGTVKIEAIVQDELSGQDVYVTFSNDAYEISSILHQADNYMTYVNLNLGEYSVNAGVFGDIRGEFQFICNYPIIMMDSDGAGLTLEVLVGEPEWISKQSIQLQNAETLPVENITAEEAETIGISDEIQQEEITQDEKDIKDIEEIKPQNNKNNSNDNRMLQIIIGCGIFIFLLIWFIVHGIKKKQKEL